MDLADTTLKGYASKAKDATAPAAPSAEEDAASDLIAAVKAGDSKAASLALKRHYELCADAEPEEAPTSEV